MITAYVTAAESDVYLASYQDWLDLDDPTKDIHLSWGRVYIDSEYLCAYTEVDATDNLKHANSMLGYMNFQGTLFADAPTLESTSVTAGSVSSSKTYSTGYKETDSMLTQSDLLLNGECASLSSSGTIGLSRN